MIHPNAASLLDEMSKHGFEVTAPIDVDDIARRLGIDVQYDHALDAEGLTGNISFLEHGALVKINPYENSYEPRRRFTLAHEIGHYCLHSNSDKTGFVDSKKTMSRSASYWNVYESQANNFAAQLLMPAKLIAEVGAHVVGVLEEKNRAKPIPVRDFIFAMAARFMVSNLAMEYRLRGMGIIT